MKQSYYFFPSSQVPGRHLRQRPPGLTPLPRVRRQGVPGPCGHGRKRPGECTQDFPQQTREMMCFYTFQRPPCATLPAHRGTSSSMSATPPKPGSVNFSRQNGKRSVANSGAQGNTFRFPKKKPYKKTLELFRRIKCKTK